MKKPSAGQQNNATETLLRGIVDRITYHNPENGWSVLRVRLADNPGHLETVVVHQTKVFAGATMEFKGAWISHAKYGRQFKAHEALERKPATTAALEKYLGSGLIKGVGPKTAGKIVKYFKEDTLRIFEQEIDKLSRVPGIARKKLEMIKAAWREHQGIREVMMFLQSHGISTLFAVRIYKVYGEQAIDQVSRDPYCLARDFYGIGFFSADRVALSIGLALDSHQRLAAGIKHVLDMGREQGHCYLTEIQIRSQVNELLDLDLTERLPGLLAEMELAGSLKTRMSVVDHEKHYYGKALYFDETYVAQRLRDISAVPTSNSEQIRAWIARYCQKQGISLSQEQKEAIKGIVGPGFSILTGGPGCGKTTTTLVLVRLLEAMDLKVLLAAPTGRAAQRMTEVIGRDAKTIHRLLEWQGGRFKRDETNPLEVDFLIIDESSMLDITLSAALLRAIPPGSRLLFIGDADQLPSVGAGNVLRDLIGSGLLPCFRLTEIFRQARESLIIRYAHQINQGELPRIDSPFNKPRLWQEQADCLFMDSDEATQEQLQFINRIKKLTKTSRADHEPPAREGYEFRLDKPLKPYESELKIPAGFRHVNLEHLLAAKSEAAELKSVLKKVHPWSSLHYGLSAMDVVKQLYIKWIPKYLGPDCEIQILSPMTRGSLGTLNLNRLIQEAANPFGPGKKQMRIGEKILRRGDRVIHRRNNYDLGVFNGDIGVIKDIDNEEQTCLIAFFPDQREILYRPEHIVELDLAYAITIHKSQGSEFEAVIIPVLSQHYKMLYRNLIYTGLTRARSLAVLVGSRRALAMAVNNQDTSRRQTGLVELLRLEE